MKRLTRKQNSGYISEKHQKIISLSLFFFWRGTERMIAPCDLVPLFLCEQTNIDLTQQAIVCRRTLGRIGGKLLVLRTATLQCALSSILSLSSLFCCLLFFSLSLSISIFSLPLSLSLSLSYIYSISLDISIYI